MNRVYVLTIKYRFGDNMGEIHPVVLKDDTNMVLVDCGYTGFLPKIEKALTENGLSYSELTHVVITHHDHDHMGSLADLKRKYPNVVVVASEKEAPFITGRQKSLRLKQAEEFQKTLPEEQKAFGEAFCKVLRDVQSAEVDHIVNDGDIFDWCGGCRIVATPGHTPGHISLYLEREKTIITGDAMAIEDGKPVIANPEFTLDMDSAKRSLEWILSCGAEKIICYHGGVYKII